MVASVKDRRQVNSADSGLHTKMYSLENFKMSTGQTSQSSFLP